MNPIVFIPGITGTKLVETNRVNFDTIWSGIQSNFETIEDLELTLPYQGRHFDQKLNSIIEPGELEELAYREFLADLEVEQVQGVRTPIYIFNYDWRFSAVNNALALKDFLSYLINKSKARGRGPTFKTFNFITHSLGNYILRAYLQNDGFEKVDKIIFTAPPFQGALDIAMAVLTGEGLFANVRAKIRKIIRTSPGALELLAAYEGAGTFAESKNPVDFFNKNHWQENTLTPDDNISQKFVRALAHSRKTVNKHLLDLRRISAEEKKRILILARNGYRTYQAIKVYEDKSGEPKNYFDFRNALVNKKGDGRVPLASSCCYYDACLTLLIEDAFYYRDYDHSFILKDERVQVLTTNFLKGGANFKYNIPGSSVRKVVGLVPKSSRGLPYIDVNLE